MLIGVKNYKLEGAIVLHRGNLEQEGLITYLPIYMAALLLFGYIEVDDPERWAAGADTAINRKWWDFMADIMETNEDNSPVSVDLPVLFHLD